MEVALPPPSAHADDAAAPRPLRIPAAEAGKPRKLRVLVAGGSFGGLAVLRELAHDANIETVLVEPRTFVEYTPSILKAVVNPGAYLSRLQLPLEACVPPGTTIVPGFLHAIEADGGAAGGGVAVIRSVSGGVAPAVAEDGTPVPTPKALAPAGDESPAPVDSLDGGAAYTLARVRFDAAVIATGSVYPPPCKAHPRVRNLVQRNTSLLHAHVDLAAAEHVVVVGGGPVGVELAAEIRTAWPAKNITIIQAGDTLLSGLPAELGAAAEAWAAANRIAVLHGQQVAAHDSVYDAEPAVELRSAAGAAAAAAAVAAAAAARGSSLVVPPSDGSPPTAFSMIRAGPSPPGPAGAAGGSGGGDSKEREAAGARRRSGEDAMLAGITTTSSSSHGTTSRLRLRSPARPPPSTSTSGTLALPPAALTPTSAARALRQAQYHTSQSHVLMTNTGTPVDADFVLYCVGTLPQTDFMARSAPHLRAARTADGRLVVDENLAVAGGAGLFAVGDVVLHPYVREPLLAYTAEKHATCVAASLRALAAARVAGSTAPVALAPYPQTITGTRSSPQIMCVSLGPDRAVLSFDSLILADPVFGQRAAALAKFVIERTKVWQLGNRTAGVLLWRVADAIAAVVHRWLPPHTPIAAAAAK